MVRCTQCNDEHFTEDVEMLNVEEDMQGRDVAFFECPMTGEVTKSLVFQAME